MNPPTYVVTGANRGLGLEFCRQLGSQGFGLIATAREPGKASELQRLASEHGFRVEALDVADPASVERFAERISGTAVDVLINNAGRGGAGSAVAELDFAELSGFFEVNSIGPLRLTRALLPHLREGNRRHVVSISSNMGSIGNNETGGYYGYRASKAALNMFNRTLALELAPEGFVCVVLHPGWVQTDMGGPQAPLTPQESIAGMLRLIGTLGHAHNGCFLDHQGAALPW